MAALGTCSAVPLVRVSTYAEASQAPTRKSLDSPLLAPFPLQVRSSSTRALSVPLVRSRNASSWLATLCETATPANVPQADETEPETAHARSYQCPNATIFPSSCFKILSTTPKTRRECIPLLFSFSLLSSLQLSGGDSLPHERMALAADLPFPLADMGDGPTSAVGEGASGKGLLSFFDSEETTAAGRRLPKAYLRTARDVVKALRESLDEQSGEDLKFRRSADAAKGAIRAYLGNWQGVASVVTEDSYKAIDQALRELSGFYKSNGPRAVMPVDVKERVLGALERASAAL
eukprot:TRINITY_DN3694_c0_g1_i1.p1 TRINITY_DN3694_c0_g1~~TRINITY_DN3694_c0_g1_i1.p1  ORF type:complete len:292 (+),score=39.56 TRINITY_DN3694_c0_g1_i1:406-1281(+)